MKISLSIEAVITLIYARVALDHTNAASASLPDILCPDRVPALREAITGAFADMAMSMIHNISDIGFPGDDSDDNLHLEIPDADNLPHGTAMLLRRHIESALAMNTLAHIYIAESSPAATFYSHQAAKSLDDAHDMLDSLTTGLSSVGSIKPWRLV